MERRHWIYVILAGMVSMFAFCSGVAAIVNATSGVEVEGKGPNKVGILDVKGPIEKDEAFLKDLKRFRENDDIKAIVVRVDSPGGAVAPSQEMHDAIVRAAGVKPVVISMGNLAASGGYYLSVGASKIFAEPGTLTGSIGVIAEMPEVDALLDWTKIKMNVYRSGKLKDMGSPFRPPTEDDRRQFQSVIDDTYDQFLNAVADGRHLKVEEVRPLADGRVFTGRQAKSKNLVDELGGFEDATLAAVQLAKLSGPPTLVYPPSDRGLSLREMLRDDSKAIGDGLTAAVAGEASRGLFYVWSGGR